MRRLAWMTGLIVLAAACSDAAGPDRAARPDGVAAPVFAKSGGIPDRYIVVLRDDVANDAQAEGQMVEENGGELTHSYRHALKGFAARLSPAAVQRLAQDPRVKFIEQDQLFTADATQTPATWGIDRIDQGALPLSGSYTYNADGSGVTVYIIDTGINANHTEFGGRASGGNDQVTVGGAAVDCNGHGTHVAGTIGGATYGVAKGVRLVAVRVLDCAGSGSTAGVAAGIDWVTGQKQATPSTPMAANMSLGGGASTALDDAVARSTSAGVTYAVAAGNDGLNACNYSPARAPSAITVGSTTNTDARSSFSNTGTCVDIFAPGSSITSAWYSSNTATNTISGTSMASPHVAGAAALYLQGNPSATPAAVAAALTTNATLNKVTGAGTGSPNRLLYTGFINATPQPPVADFSSSCTGLACSFDGGLSSAQAGATYSWSWGDATADGSGKTASHTYAASGTYSVTLTVTDALGSSTKTKTVTVSNAPPAPVANFTFSCNRLVCSFTSTSTAQANATYKWVWGDNKANGSGKTASHTYSARGTYNVTLTATDAGGSSSKTTAVTVRRK